MSTLEKKSTFFRQSGWMVIANTMCGGFMILVHSFASLMPGPEWALFATLLRFFTILAIPAAGLQNVLAKQAAAAVTEESRRNLAATVRSVLRAIFLLWVVFALCFAFFQQHLVQTFQIENPAALWVTLVLVLGAFCLPVVQGLLQGLQDFLWLGISMILNGVGRFLAVGLFVGVLGLYAAGAMGAALLGVVAAVAICLWPLRKLIPLPGGRVDWRDWMRQVIPLSFGTGAVVFVMNADMLFVQSHFPADSKFYGAGAMVGVGIVTFTAPMAWVMFPKLARSFALSQGSNALYLAAGGTAVLGILAALGCALLPELPVRMLFFRKPEFWRAADLVPWFAAGLVPITMANVLIADLLARERFKIVPWLIAIAIGYGLALYYYVNNLGAMEPFAAFKQVVKILSAFSLLTLATSGLFTWLDRRKG
jgi:O-antigen/teichoic acid export membrane protein